MGLNFLQKVRTTASACLRCVDASGTLYLKNSKNNTFYQSVFFVLRHNPFTVYLCVGVLLLFQKNNTHALLHSY